MLKLTSTSWVEIIENSVDCSKEQFDALWDECPEIHGTIKIYGKTIEIPRFQKLYGYKGVTYSFSGTKLEADPNLPDLVSRCMKLAGEKYPPMSQWNGALVNFYPDGESYISQHSDDERDLVSDAPILSFSFGCPRFFVLKSKKLATINELKLSTTHCSLIVMGGDMQKQYTHGISKATKKEGTITPRINITIRAFNIK